MLCENCGEREAECELPGMAGGETSAKQLCRPCAEACGLFPDVTTQMLWGLFAGSCILPPGGEPTARREGPLRCPDCGATIEDLRSSGRTGCPTCWVTFEEQLRSLTRRLHGDDRYVGEGYRGPTGEGDHRDRERRREIARLRRELAEAVNREEYELAGQLRDLLAAKDSEA